MSALLTGLRVVNTRAPHQAGELDRALIAAGALPLAYPCISIAPPPETAPLDAALTSLADGHFDWLVLTSVNTVEALRQRQILVPPCVRVAAVGTITARVVHDLLNSEVAFVPLHSTASSLARTLPIKRGDRVLIPSSAVAGDEVARMLTRRGAKVSSVVAYDTGFGSGGIDLLAAVAQGEVDALIFASPSAVQGLLFRFMIDRPYWKRFDLPAVCIGGTTADAAAGYGFTNIFTAAEPSVAGLLAALADTVGHRG